MVNQLFVNAASGQPLNRAIIQDAANALPQSARASVNCRILPGEPVEEVQKTLVRVLADDQIYAVGEHHILALDQQKQKAGFGWFAEIGRAHV